MRTGPTPLALHLSLAATAAGGDAALLAAYMAGIRKYQNSAHRRTLPDLPVVWQAGEVTLRQAGGGAGSDRLPPLLVIPSLINRPTILDIEEGYSFVRWMAARGRNVLLLDWGEPKNDPALRHVDPLVGERLIPAMAQAALIGRGRFHAMGYCMGGTLLAAATAIPAGPAPEKSVFLATPWDFDAGDRVLQAQVLSFAASGQSLMALHGVLPASWVQTVFACVDPARLLQKYVRFSHMAEDDPAARLFVAVEDWLNDAVDLPQGIAQMCIQDWYVANAPAAETWRVGGRPVMLRDVTSRALVLCANNDTLVPPESSRALSRMLPHATYKTVDAGHIGLLAGREAADQVWQTIERFLF